jgi:DNA-binding winged helix-turn-helix (wHTH) protein/Tol biopolymer transport system component
MSNGANRLYEFGPYRVDPARNVLFRGSTQIPLTTKAFETLLVLIEHGDDLVSKEELMGKLWPNTIVEEANLAQHISMVRKALGETPQERRYIITLPGRGYRFAERIRIISSDVAQSDPGTRVDPPAAVEVPPPHAPVPVEELNSRHEVRRSGNLPWVVAACVALFLMVAAFLLRPEVPSPKVTRIRQLTHVGNVSISQRIVTDGPRIYFLVDGEKDILRYASADGGAIFSVNVPFTNFELTDTSPNGTELLLQDYDGWIVPRTLWRLSVPDGSPRRIGEVRGDDSAWSHDGRAIAYTRESDDSLNMADAEGKNSRKLASFPGTPFRPRWSPDGNTIRLSVSDKVGSGCTLWEINVANGTSRPLLPGWSSSTRPMSGRWTDDGRYFLFSALQDGLRNIWAIRDAQEILRKSSRNPVQLTAGPMNFSQPAPSKDGKTIFAVGEVPHGQLMRYNQNSRQFEPYAGDLSADHVAFSRDGKSMAYIQYPEGNLFRSRVDGTDRQQLTFPPLRAYCPQWSPDGSQLAFIGIVGQSGPRSIFVIPAHGGSPRLIAPDTGSQPSLGSWTSEGLLVAGANARHPNSAMYRLQVETGQLQFLPGSDGLAAGMESADGKYIAAVSYPDHRVALYDVRTQTWKAVAKQGDYPAWCPDQRCFYFNTVIGWTGEKGYYRFNLAGDTVERALAAPDFPLTGVYGFWSSFAPDGSLLVFRSTSTRDIYALEVQLP